MKSLKEVVQPTAQKLCAKYLDLESYLRLHAKQAIAKEDEVDLKEKHGSTYSPFQYKLWAEMVANESHNSLDEPPAAAMFNRETRQSRSISIIDKLCAAVIPKREKG